MLGVPDFKIMFQVCCWFASILFVPCVGLFGVDYAFWNYLVAFVVFVGLCLYVVFGFLFVFCGICKLCLYFVYNRKYLFFLSFRYYVRVSYCVSDFCGMVLACVSN